MVKGSEGSLSGCRGWKVAFLVTIPRSFHLRSMLWVQAFVWMYTYEITGGTSWSPSSQRAPRNGPRKHSKKRKKKRLNLWTWHPNIPDLNPTKIAFHELLCLLDSIWAVQLGLDPSGWTLIPGRNKVILTCKNKKNKSLLALLFRSVDLLFSQSLFYLSCPFWPTEFGIERHHHKKWNVNKQKRTGAGRDTAGNMIMSPIKRVIVRNIFFYVLWTKGLLKDRLTD